MKTSFVPHPSAASLHLLGGPLLWSAHFLATYAWTEFACQTQLLALHSTIWGIPVLSHVVLGLTLAGILATGYVGVLAYRRWRGLKPVQGGHEAVQWALEGERFAAFSGVLLCGLFALVILLTGLPALVLRPCL